MIMDKKLDSILNTNEVFHDGMDSAFSIRLHELIKEYGKPVIISLRKRLLDGRLTRQVACEALIQCGNIVDGLPELEYSILRFASYGLKHKSADIRDSAGLCIASIDNPIMIMHISNAIENEGNNEIKEGLQQVLDQLVKTAQDSGNPNGLLDRRVHL